MLTVIGKRGFDNHRYQYVSIGTMYMTLEEVLIMVSGKPSIISPINAASLQNKMESQKAETNPDAISPHSRVSENCSSSCQHIQTPIRRRFQLSS